MEYSKEDLIEAKRQILGGRENMGTEESKKIWEKNAQFWDNGDADGKLDAWASGLESACFRWRIGAGPLTCISRRA